MTRPCAAPATAPAAPTGSIPSGTSSGCRVIAAKRRSGATSGSSRSRFRTYVSSPVRWRPSTSASTATSATAHAIAFRYDATVASAVASQVSAARGGDRPRAARRAARAHVRFPPRSTRRRVGRRARRRQPTTSSIALPALVTTGRAAEHRLEHRDAEALEQRRVCEAERAAQLRSRAPRRTAAPASARARPRRRPAPAPRARDPQLEAEPARGVDQPRQVLPRLERPDREHVVAGGALARRA